MDKTPSATEDSKLLPQDDASRTPAPPQSSPFKPAGTSPLTVDTGDNASPLENVEKEKSGATAGSSPSDVRLVDKDKDAADSNPKSPSPIQPPTTNNNPSNLSPPSTNDEETKGDLDKTDSKNSHSDKSREMQSIIPIKGKASPKSHVIRVTEKKETENDTKSKPNSAATNKNDAKKLSEGNNSNSDAKSATAINSKENTNGTNDGKNATNPGKEQTVSSQNLSEKVRGSRTSVLQRQRTYMKLMREEAKTSDIAKDICKMFSVLFAVGVRAVLWGFSMFTIWLVVFRLDDEIYYLMCITFIFHIIETLNIVISRAGQERKWFCLCFLSYLSSTVPCIWILEVDKLNDFQSAVANATELEVGVAGVTANITLDPNTLLAVTEQCLIFLLILCRWLLPRGDITRDQLSQLLFVYIGMASDVMELFTLFDESNVREDTTLTYVILAVWSLSLLQFTLVLTMSRNPKKIRTAMDHDNETNRIKRKKLKDRSFILMLTQSELWSLCVSIFMQDGPFLAVRLFTMVRHSLVNYTIIFFTCKNILVILLLLYRVMILLVQKWEDSKKKKEEGNDDYIDSRSKHSDGDHLSKTVSTHLSLSDLEDETRHLSINSSNGDGKANPEGLRSRTFNQISPA